MSCTPAAHMAAAPPPPGGQQHTARLSRETHPKTVLLREICSGGLAAGFTASLFNPLELVKTRMQVQELMGPWPPSGRAKLYPNFVSGLRTIAAEDGLAALWSYGFFGFVGRDLIYSGIRIGGYPSVRGMIAGGREESEIGLPRKILAGCTTGAIGSAITNPLDVVRVRMSVESGLVGPAGRYTTGLRAGHPPRYLSSPGALLAIFREEGLVRGLYAGTTATMARAAALSGGQLASYDHTKHLLKSAGLMQEGTRLHLVAGIVSGIVATTCCNPPDVIKSRLMRDPTLYKGPLDCALQTLAREGPRAFFKGWLPAYARAGPAFFIQMPIVEQLRIAFGVPAL
eukprot:SAG22_NODE_597_length_8708_cov_11.511209_2_plen_342_part_00